MKLLPIGQLCMIVGGARDDVMGLHCEVVRYPRPFETAQYSNGAIALIGGEADHIILVPGAPECFKHRMFAARRRDLLPLGPPPIVTTQTRVEFDHLFRELAT